MARLFKSSTMMMLAAVSLLMSNVVMAEDKPMRRLQSTTGAGAGVASLFEAKNAPVDPSQMLDAVKPDAELAMMQDVWKNGANAMELFSKAFQSEGFKVIQNNVEIQHRILEEFPLLAAYDGFKQARGRRLSDEDTKVSFATGIKTLLEVTGDAMTKIKDPSSSIRALSELASSPDQGIQDLFLRATDGDKAAVEEIEDLLNAKQFPGIDTKALKDLAASNPIQKLIDNKEVMRFIDEDPVVSAAIRNPLDIESFVANFAASRKH